MIEQLEEDNPWWFGDKAETPSFERDYLQELFELIERGRPIVLIGPRRVGKTTMLYQLANRLADNLGGENILYIRTDLISTLSENPILDAINEYSKRILRGKITEKNAIILIDEAHYDPKWSIVVKGLYDRIQSKGGNTKIIATGSSSTLIEMGIRENLSGRIQKLLVFPMKLSELLRARGYKREILTEVSKLVRKSLFEGNTDSLEEAEATLVNISLIKSLISDYMIRGGMPEIILRDKANYKEEKELLLNYVSLSIYKDVLRAFETIKRSFRRPGLLEDLMRIIAYKSPREINYNSLASSLGIKVDTVEDLVSAILSTMYVLQARNYAKHPEIIARKRKRKYFFIDVGVRNALARTYKPTISEDEEGLIIENLALVNTLRIVIEEKIGNEVYYWREDGREIDIVTENFCIEVKRGKKYRVSPFITFARKYGKRIFIKLTTEELGEKNEALLMPIYLFLLA